MFSWLNGERIGLRKIDNIYYYQAGEIFEPSKLNDIKRLYYILKNRNFSNLKDTKGEFAFFIEDSENIYVFVDEIGTIKWYYYYDENNFFISNNFWDIVKKLKPSIDDIDKKAIYEYILLNKAFDEKSFIKGIQHIKGGEVLIFNKVSKFLDRVSFTEINYNPSQLKERDVIEEIDFLFKKTIEKIREFNSNSKFGLTISGGLDSRFPLPYVKKDEVASTYLIGKKNGIFTPLDYDSAKEMASLYGFKFKMIDPFSIDVLEKAMIDILRNPTPNSNIMKALNYEKVFNKEFDVLLTGAYGGLIGGRVLDKSLLNFSSIEEFSYKMFEKYSLYALFEYYKDFNVFSPYKRHLNKLYSFFGIEKSRPYKEMIDNFLSNNFLIKSEDKQRLFNNFKKHLETFQKGSNSNLTTVMRFHLSVHSIRGGFESLHGQVKAYSIYNPYVYNFSKNWPVEFLGGRRIMEIFLLKKYPELAKVPLQTWDLPLVYKYSDINLLLKIYLKNIYLAKFLIKRLAINYTTWWNTKEMKEFRNKIFSKESYFYEILNKKDVLKINSISQFTHLANNLLKIKLLIDSIETKNYKNFEDKFVFSGKY